MTNFALWCSVNRNGLPMSSNRPLTSKEEDDLSTVLLALSDIEGLTRVMALTINLKRTFEIVLNKRPGSRRFAFPARAIDIAQEAFDRYESEGWGVDPQNELLNLEDVPRDSLSPSPSSNSTRPSFNNEPLFQGVTRPPPNHPIYGRGGIMEGILIKRGPNRIDYVFGRDDISIVHSFIQLTLADANFRRTCFRPFGHNGITIGQRWPMQKAAHRDGAHGNSGSGIAGTVAEGANSIIVSGKYRATHSHP